MCIRDSIKGRLKNFEVCHCILRFGSRKSVNLHEVIEVTQRNTIHNLVSSKFSDSNSTILKVTDPDFDSDSDSDLLKIIDSDSDSDSTLFKITDSDSDSDSTIFKITDSPTPRLRLRLRLRLHNPGCPPGKK